MDRRDETNRITGTVDSAMTLAVVVATSMSMKALVFPTENPTAGQAWAPATLTGLVLLIFSVVRWRR